jgi:hypothetical protein
MAAPMSPDSDALTRIARPIASRFLSMAIGRGRYACGRHDRPERRLSSTITAHRTPKSST